VENIPYLDGSATYDAARNMLCLALVNYHEKEPAEVEIDVSDLNTGKSGIFLELNASDPFIGNDFENPDRVQVVERELTLEASRFAIRLSPSSLSVLEVPLKTPLGGGVRL
jgi:alpha-N-arabinofuranosidase